MIWSYLAKQARKPFGFVGRKLMGRFFNKGNERLIRHALAALDPEPSHVVLDIGFGGALSFELLTDERGIRELYGVDFSTAMVKGARDRYRELIDSGRLQLYHADASNMPLPDDSVDRVLTANTVYFWEDLEEVLTEIRRVLRPGGRLALAFRSPESLNRLKPTQFGFVKRTAGEIQAIVEEAGFENVSSTHYDKDRHLDSVIVVAHA